MPSKPVQISLDTKLLARIDRDPEVKKRGRSAFIRMAVEHYLAEKRGREEDARFRAAYSDPEAVRQQLEETILWEKVQSWPED